MENTPVLYERTFFIPSTLVNFINKNGIKQDQIVSIVTKNIPGYNDEKGIGIRGHHTVYFYHSGDFKYELGTYLPVKFLRSVKSDRLQIYSDNKYWIFPLELMNDIPVDKLQDLLLDLNT